MKERDKIKLNKVFFFPPEEVISTVKLYCTIHNVVRIIELSSYFIHLFSLLGIVQHNLDGITLASQLWEMNKG